MKAADNRRAGTCLRKFHNNQRLCYGIHSASAVLLRDAESHKSEICKFVNCILRKMSVQIYLGRNRSNLFFCKFPGQILNISLIISHLKHIDLPPRISFARSSGAVCRLLFFFNLKSADGSFTAASQIRVWTVA